MISHLVHLVPISICFFVCRNLAGKGLSGSLPSDSSIWAPLQTTLLLLELSNNALTGQVPSALDQLTALQTLELHDNQFSGSLPDLAGLTQMTVVNFASNQLTGGACLHACMLDWRPARFWIPFACEAH